MLILAHQLEELEQQRFPYFFDLLHTAGNWIYWITGVTEFSVDEMYKLV